MLISSVLCLIVPAAALYIMDKDASGNIRPYTLLVSKIEYLAAVVAMRATRSHAALNKTPVLVALEVLASLAFNLGDSPDLVSDAFSGDIKVFPVTRWCVRSVYAHKDCYEIEFAPISR